MEQIRCRHWVVCRMGVFLQNRNMEARLFMFVQEAFEGRTAKLDQDQDLVLYGKASGIGLAIQKLHHG